MDAVKRTLSKAQHRSHSSSTTLSRVIEQRNQRSPATESWSWMPARWTSFYRLQEGKMSERYCRLSQLVHLQYICFAFAQSLPVCSVSLSLTHEPNLFHLCLSLSVTVTAIVQRHPSFVSVCELTIHVPHSESAHLMLESLLLILGIRRREWYCLAMLQYHVLITNLYCMFLYDLEGCSFILMDFLMIAALGF